MKWQVDGHSKAYGIHQRVPAGLGDFGQGTPLDPDLVGRHVRLWKARKGGPKKRRGREQETGRDLWVEIQGNFGSGSWWLTMVFTGKY